MLVFLEITSCLILCTDVIAIVKDVAPLSEITSKAQNRTVRDSSVFYGRVYLNSFQIPKRELTLVDKSGYSVRLTLWGKQAEQYNSEGTPVIAFKGVKVGDFGGDLIHCLPVLYT